MVLAWVRVSQFPPQGHEQKADGFKRRPIPATWLGNCFTMSKTGGRIALAHVSACLNTNSVLETTSGWVPISEKGLVVETHTHPCAASDSMPSGMIVECQESGFPEDAGPNELNPVLEPISPAKKQHVESLNIAQPQHQTQATTVIPLTMVFPEARHLVGNSYQKAKFCFSCR